MSNRSSNHTSLLSLQEVQWMYFLRQDIAVFIFVLIAGIMGTFGNSLTIWIYSMRFQSSNHRTLILFLAATDLTMCLFGVPYFMVAARHSYTFYSMATCKCFSFLGFFLVTYSLLLVDLIAVERYTKICRPTISQWSERKTLQICLVLAVVSLCVIGIPASIIYGATEVTTGTNRMTGLRCAVQRKWQDSLSSRIFHGSSSVFVLAGCLFCVVIYGLISKTLAAQGKLFDKDPKVSDSDKIYVISPNCDTTTFSSCDIDNESVDDGIKCPASFSKVPIDHPAQVVTNVIGAITQNSDNASNVELRDVKGDCGRLTNVAGQHMPKNVVTKSKPKNARYIRSVQITRMLMVSSALSYLFCLVFPIIAVWNGINKQSYQHLRSTGGPMFPVVERLFVLNHAINPIIYCALNTKFRRECRLFYSSWKQKICK